MPESARSRTEDQTEEPYPERAAMRLSKRQAEIIAHVAEGHSTKEIADILQMSPKTVESHMQRLFDRYGVRTRAAIVARWMSAFSWTTTSPGRPPEPADGDDHRRTGGDPGGEQRG